MTDKTSSPDPDPELPEVKLIPVTSTWTCPKCERQNVYKEGVVSDPQNKCFACGAEVKIGRTRTGLITDPKLLPERIWIQRDTSFFQTMGNGTYYRDPDNNSIGYHRDDLCTPVSLPTSLPYALAHWWKAEAFDGTGIQEVAENAYAVGLRDSAPSVATADTNLAERIASVALGKIKAPDYLALEARIAYELTAAERRGYEQARKDGLDAITHDNIMSYMIADEVVTVGVVIGRSRKLLRALTPPVAEQEERVGPHLFNETKDPLGAGLCAYCSRPENDSIHADAVAQQEDQEEK